MKRRKILFIDRDGTLLVEPPDEQVDCFEKFDLLPEVIASLRELTAAGYELVMVSNQDGLGSAAYPEASFNGPQALLLRIFASQGIVFSAVHIDRSLPADNAPTRKPGIGMLLEYLRSGALDRAHSAVIGDRQTDLELAVNLGIAGYRLGPDLDWPALTRRLIATPRRAELVRETGETRIAVEVDLDREQPIDIATGLPIFDHFVEQLARHGGFSLVLKARGDWQIDDHHSVEDCALALGAALDQALGERRGINRYGFMLPMDEALVEVALDLSGRPWYVQRGTLPRESIGGLSAEMIRHFFHSLAQALGAALHIRIEGENTHHMAEAMFKGTGRALRSAVKREGTAVPSSKGVL